jgi:hypothetical protein
MTTPLTNTARTILRSRLRRHPEIDKHLAPTDSVASLTNADLVQTARLLGIALPSPVEIEAYQTARGNGMSGSLAIDAADAVAPSLTVAPITASTFAMVADELVESDEKEEAPLDAATPINSSKIFDQIMKLATPRASSMATSTNSLPPISKLLSNKIDHMLKIC